MINRFKSFPFVQKKSSLNILKAWIGLKIAEDINPAVYLSHYCRWRFPSKDAPEERKNVLVLPRFHGVEYLIAHVQKERLTDDILLIKNWRRTIKMILFIFVHIFLAILTISVSWMMRTGKKQDKQASKKPCLLAQYSLGMNGDERNDIPFIHAVDFDLARLNFVIQNPIFLPDTSEVRWMLENNASFFFGPDVSLSHPEIPSWRSSWNRRREWIQFCKTFLKFSLQRLKYREKYSLWLLFHLWEVGKKTSYWKDYFISNEVKVAVHSFPSAKQFLFNLSLSEVGGISIQIEQTVLYDYCTYIHNFPCHIKFVTGPYSLTQIPEPLYSQHTIQCGAIQSFDKNLGLNGIDMKNNKKQIVIALFDEMPNDWFFGDSIRQLYEALIDLVQNDRRFYLLVKTKKNQVFKRLQDVKTTLKQLQQEGKCQLLEWKTSVSTAVHYSDLAVSVPSTAAFESVLAGKPTIVFNPMRTGMNLFYKNSGLNRRVFEDEQSMIFALKKFAEGDSTVGDCRELLPELDSFNDGQGAERIGTYIQKCLEAFDYGQSREDILRTTNQWYAELWGDDKLSKRASTPHE